MVEHFLARHGLFLCLFIISPTVPSARGEKLGPLWSFTDNELVVLDVRSFP